MRTVVRSTLIAGMTGALMVSVAWAGIGISPVPGGSAPAAVTDAVNGLPGTPAVAGGSVQANGINPVSLGAGELLVGAAKTSMNPRPADIAAKYPDLFPDARWETDPVACTPTEPAWYADLPKAALMATDGIANPGST